MFVALADALSGTQEENAEQVLTLDAGTVSFLMDATWNSGGPGLLTGTSTAPIITPTTAQVWIDLPGLIPPGTWSPIWDHLIYAYMIENTRAYEIMGRVIAEYSLGERLGILQNDSSYRWIRTTEELFYKDASPFQPYNLVSRLRPDIAGTRRNAYYRMFGMDLNHGRDGAPSYPYPKPPTANREFVATFEEFLREVWRAIENANNFLANNPTDFPSLIDLADRLQNMLTARRGGAFDRPNLSREEFLAVAMAAWLDLTLSVDTPIVRELSASGPSPEERLRQIGDRVGIASHGRSHSYFIIAAAVSSILIAIEQGDFNDMTGVQTLAAPGVVRDTVSTVIHHWSIISGRDLKSGRTTTSPMLPAASPGFPVQPSTNGSTSSMGAPMVALSAGGNGKVPV